MYRVSKDWASLTKKDVERTVAFHTNFVRKYFVGFVHDQKVSELPSALAAQLVHTSKPIPCVKTKNLIGPCCVELKPKYPSVDGIPTHFVLKQKGESSVFDPQDLFRDGGDIPQTLHSAYLHPKKYLKIHNRGKFDTEWLMRSTAKLLATPPMRDLFKRIQSLQRFGADAFAPTARRLYELLGTEADRLECVDVFEDFDEFASTSYTGILPQLATKWLNTFLAGRMVRDVSLLINFSDSPGDCPGGLPSVQLAPSVYASVGMVDTDLKPRSKIFEYAPHSS